MLELIRTTVLAGLGAGVITRDKAEEVLNRLVDEGKVTADEANNVVSDLLDSGSRQWEEVQSGLSGALRQALDSMDLPSGEDITALTDRLENAELRITMLQNNLEQLRIAAKA